MKKVVLSVIITVFLSFALLVYLGILFTDQFAEEKFDKLLSKVKPVSIAKNQSALLKPLELYKMANIVSGITPQWIDASFESFIKTDINSPYLNYPYRQISLTNKPAYVTDGLIKTNDWVNIRSIESFIEGEGNLLNKFVSSITISDAKGLQINQNALTRYLLESIVFAPSLLSNKSISFKQLDSNVIHAKIELDTLVSEVKFYINYKNEIYLAETENKFRTTKLGYTKLLHRTYYYDYKNFDNFRIPTRIEHSWINEDSSFTYHKINLTKIEYH